MMAPSRAPSPPAPVPLAWERADIAASSASRARLGVGRRLSGFTLLELLVAIWILAIVSIIAWRGMSALIATRDRLAPETDDVRALLRGFGQMELDLAQAANPGLISLGGPSVRVRVVDGMPTLQILRFSQSLSDGGSAVQQVTYTVTGGTLLRQASPPLRSVQAALNSTQASVPLVAGVAS